MILKSFNSIEPTQPGSIMSSPIMLLVFCSATSSILMLALMSFLKPKRESSMSYPAVAFASPERLKFVPIAICPYRPAEPAASSTTSRSDSFFITSSFTYCRGLCTGPLVGPTARQKPCPRYPMAQQCTRNRMLSTLLAGGGAPPLLAATDRRPGTLLDARALRNAAARTPSPAGYRQIASPGAGGAQDLSPRRAPKRAAAGAETAEGHLTQERPR